MQFLLQRIEPRSERLSPFLNEPDALDVLAGMAQQAQQRGGRLMGLAKDVDGDVNTLHSQAFTISSR
jgi:hypothetical protein